MQSIMIFNSPSMLYIYLAILKIICVDSYNIVNPGPAFPPTNGEVWPKPQQQIKENDYYKLSPSIFKFTEKEQTCEILKSAIQRYSSILKSTHHIAWRHSKKIWKHAEPRSVNTDPYYKGNLEELQIYLKKPCEAYPHLDMDEKYSLNVSAVSVLKSDSIWGILRGMETFAQLFYMSQGYKHAYINTTQIVDFPRYTYRGLLIDTSRHYLSVQNILKTLDAMEMNKMNVLHWHIVDDQSFPYQSEKFPELSKQGAYDPSMVYSNMHIRQIVNYARNRGIRVLPEFDVPGHTRSWGVAYPNILTKCYQFGEMIGLGPMDPTNNVTYKLIGDLFKEVQERFPDKYIHLGGDEVAMECWLSNPELLRFMQEHEMNSPNELHAYFMTNVIPLLGQKSKPIVWQEVFDEGVTLPKDAIVQVWKTVGAEDMIRILYAGYKVIYSSSWYLDHFKHGEDWTSFYIIDPRRMFEGANFVLEDIVGGEACMWGEVVDDSNIMARVWPRASAVAEVLWSAVRPNYGITRAHHIASRLEEQACRMNRRGIPTQPPNAFYKEVFVSGFCLDYEILAADHKLIYSSSWYLDYLSNGGDWDKFYSADPRQMIPKRYKDLNLNNILGGEACMWGEAVDDTNLMSRVWPRASAVAEKLWSAEQPRYNYYRSIAVEVSRRLEEHACRMNRRGVRAQPPNGPGFCIGAV